MRGPIELAEDELLRVLTALGLEASVSVTAADREGDGYRWSVIGNAVAVHGDSPRGALFGAYAFLNELGVIWPVPAREVLPTNATLPADGSSGASEPALPGRCLIIGSIAFLPRLEEWVAWCARNRLNTIFFHTSPPGSGAIGAIPFEAWMPVRDEAARLLKERGLVFEMGGHGLTHLLDRDRFAEIPDAFRMHKGERKPDTNFCSSSPVALDILREGARKIFEENPSVDSFHVWPDDMGGWCSCPSCEGVSPSEQSMRAVIAVAEVLAEVNPSAQLAAIAYIETEDPPVSKPPANVFLLWAPRKRCYGHDLSDTDCEINEPRYRAGFRELSQNFVANGAAPTRVFEYWLDAILFKSAFPVFARVGADIRKYRDDGVHTVQSLMVGPREILGDWPAAWLYAQLLWNPDLDEAQLLQQYSEKVLADGALGDYFLTLDHAMNLALELEVPTDPNHNETVKQIFANGGFPDMEDPVGVEIDGLRRIIARHDQALAIAEAGAAGLANSTAAQEAEVILRWIRFAHARAVAYLGLRTDAPDTKELFDAAHALSKEFVSYLCAQFDVPGDNGTPERIKGMHAFSWRNVLHGMAAASM